MFQEIINLIENKKFDEAIQQLNEKIQDKSLSKLDILKNQFFLGYAYKKQGELDKAIETYLSIKREDNAEIYASSRFNLGLIYKKQENFEQEIETYLSIKREDSAELYAKSRFKLGSIYDNQENFEKAIESYLSIEREDGVEQYAKSRVNLGLIYDNQENFEQAIESYLSIEREDGVEQYAKSRFNLGLIYDNQENFEQAIETYLSIDREDDAEQYAKSRVNLGLIYQNQKNFEEAIQTYLSIEREDDTEQYAISRFNLAVLYEEQKNLNKAIESYLSISQIDDKDIYIDAQFNIGVIYKEQENLQKAIDIWSNISAYDLKDDRVYIAQNILKISKTSEVSDIEQKSKLIDILVNVEEIVELLLIQDEDAIAHYTTLTVSKLLLSLTSENKSESPFRLNTIRLMNDPKEGKLLNPLIGLANEKEAKNIAFISSFTLHHDSLNQFRLYGKEDEKEASGVSLVLGKSFFSAKHDTSSMCSTKPSKKIISDDNGCITFPLYRCIYLDPNSGFFKIAHREEWSFYRQIVKTNISDIKNKDKLEEQKKQAKEQWEQYSNQFLEMEEEIRKKLEELTQHIQTIKNDLLSNPAIEQLLAEILLPLRYLIKHIAFREEQECRIIRIVDPKDEAIKYHSQINRVYLDYEPCVLEHLKKVYLAPKAEDEKEIYEHLCISGRKKLDITKVPDVRVKISQHPFR